VNHPGFRGDGVPMPEYQMGRHSPECGHYCGYAHLKWMRRCLNPFGLDSPPLAGVRLLHWGFAGKSSGASPALRNNTP